MVASCTESDLGSSDWRIFLNDGTAFSAAGGRWTLPTGYPAGAFGAAAVDEADCGTGSPAWFLADLTADHRPDIVVTAACDALEVGDTQWRVYENTAARFDTSRVAWALPPGYTAGAFAHRLAATPTCDGSDTWPAWQLLDLAGDAQTDIVILDDCADAGVGTLTWLEAVGSCG